MMDSISLSLSAVMVSTAFSQLERVASAAALAAWAFLPLPVMLFTLFLAEATLASALERRPFTPDIWDCMESVVRQLP